MKKLSSVRWLGLFFLSVLLLALLLAGFNVVTDPFGAFGDRFFTWWSYDETNNPRVAKLSYLEQHHDEYDSYVIGCSSTSSYPTEQLNEYFDASFYNLIMYGADLLDVEQMSAYLIGHYTVRNLVVNLYIDNALVYNDCSNALTHSLPPSVTGESAVRYYAPFLFATPSYGLDKLKKLRSDPFLQQNFDVFNEQTGTYDKSVRDVEPIGDLNSYYEAYPVFLNYPKAHQYVTQTENCVKSLAGIRDLCAENGVNLVVVAAPVYYDYLTCFEPAQVEAFYTALANVTPFWDFTASSVSREPRYFYDATHFRNAVGVMALARMFGDESVYIPADFGVYVTPENAAEHFASYWTVPEPKESEYTDSVPILMYHHLDPSPANAETVSPETFAAQIAALSQAGYTAVGFEELSDYVNFGTPLPENPIVITFDDGYASNLTLAEPILARYGMKATVFVIGVSAGKDTYKDSGAAMTPHFALADTLGTALEIGSHGWNVHEVAGRDPDPVRQGVLPKAGEREEDYIAFFRDDCAAMNRLLSAEVGHSVQAFAYPFGYHTTLSEVLLRESGVQATVTVAPGRNTLVKGLPQSLYCLRRFTVTEQTAPEELLAMISE